MTNQKYEFPRFYFQYVVVVKKINKKKQYLKYENNTQKTQLIDEMSKKTHRID